jgi:hypothetical protein
MISDSLIKRTREDEPIGIYDSSSNRNVFFPNTERINYAKNPSFEVDTSGWSAFPNHVLTRNATDAFIGSACGELEILTTAATVGSYDGLVTAAESLVPVTAGEDVYVSVYVKNLVGARNIRLQVAGFATTVADVQLQAVANTATNPTAWTRLQARITVASGSNFVGASVRFLTAGSTSDKVLIDGWLIEKSSTLKDYFDGTFYEGAWKGLPHLSYSYNSIPEGSLSYLKDNNTLYARTHKWESIAELAYPSQEGESGKYLETDGTYFFWDASPINNSPAVYFNPNSGMTGWTIGNAISNYFYGRAGKMVVLRIFHQFGTTTAEGASGTLTATLPVNASANAIGTMANGFWIDINGSPYKAVARITSATTVEFYWKNRSGNTWLIRNFNTSTRPFTIASMDQLNVTLVYEGE